MLDMYRARNPQQALGAQGGTSTASNIGQSIMGSLANTEQESSRIKKLERLIKKKL